MGSSNIIRLPEPGEYVIASFSQEHRLGYGAMELQPMVQAPGYLHVVQGPRPHCTKSASRTLASQASVMKCLKLVRLAG
jgi:hypothetical protein